MAGNSLNLLLRQVRTLAGRADEGQATDRTLLERFVRSREDGAFAELARRHGPMVWSVCKSVLQMKLGVALLMILGLGGLGLTLAAEGLGTHSVADPHVATNNANPPSVGAEKKPKASSRDSVADREEPAGHDRYGDPLPPGALARLGTARFRQQTYLTALAFSNDGKLLAGNCLLLGVVLWESATGRQLRVIETGDQRGRPFDFCPDGKTLATVDQTGDISLWEIASGKRLRTIPYSTGYPRPTDIRFSPNGKVVACNTTPGNTTVALLDAASGKLLHIIGGRPATIYQAVFSPDSKHVLLTTHAPCLELWDVATGKLLRGMADRPDTSAQGAAVFSPDGKLIAASLWEELAIFDALTGNEVFRLPRKFKVRLSGLGPVFTRDGKKLLFHGDSKVWILDIASKRLQGGFDAPGEFPALSPDGTTMALGSSRIRLWDVASGKELFQQFEGHRTPVTGLFVGADNRTLFSAAEDGEIRIWDTATAQESGRFNPTGRVTGLSPDGTRLILVRHDKKGDIGVWDLAGRREVLALQLPDRGSKRDYVQALYTPDGTGLISLEYRRSPGRGEWGDSRLLVWDAVTGRSGRRLLLKDVDPGALALAPDGRTAYLIKNDRSAQFYSGAILCIDLQRGRVFRSLKALTYDLIPTGLAISPDGKLLASASYDWNVRLWETDSGQEVFALAGRQPALAVAFSPDGRILATAGSVLGFASAPKGPQTIRLWDVVTGREVHCFQGHAADVNALAFSLDGKKLFSGQKDSTVLVWDVAPVRPVPLKRASLGQTALQKLWVDLAGNARQAHAASWRLVANPDQAVPFLRSRVKPVHPVDAARLRRLIADLDSERFQVRESARRALELLDRQAEEPIRQALAGATSLELRRRLENVLSKSILVPDVLRGLRAVTTLERIDRRDARSVLESLAKGDSDARLTEAAKAALKRLAGKKG